MKTDYTSMCPSDTFIRSHTHTHALSIYIPQCIHDRIRTVCHTQFATCSKSRISHSAEKKRTQRRIESPEAVLTAGRNPTSFARILSPGSDPISFRSISALPYTFILATHPGHPSFYLIRVIHTDTISHPLEELHSAILG